MARGRWRRRPGRGAMPGLWRSSSNRNTTDDNDPEQVAENEGASKDQESALGEERPAPAVHESSENERASSGSRRRRRIAPARMRERDLWRLRMLVGTPAIQRLDETHRVDRFLGVFGLSEARAEKMRPDTIARHAARYLEEAERSSTVIPDALSRSSELLAGALGLGRVESSILALSAAFSVDDLLRDTIELAGCTGPMEVYSAIGAAIDKDPREVRRALRPDSALGEAGLVQMSFTDGMSHEVPLKILHGLDEILLGDVETAEELLESFFTASPGPKLTTDDMAHLAKDLEILSRMMAAAVEEKRAGINVLIHGPTGTGKTQLARLLAKELSVQLFEVADADEEGDSIAHQMRFCAYVLCQRMLSSGGPSLVLFDEVEDVFPQEPSLFMTRPKGAAGKAWTNRLLESNPVPTIWVANEVRQMDPAYLRRFSHVLELRRPPPSVRERLVRSMLGPLGVGEERGRRIASDDRLSPGHIEAAAQALSLVKPAKGREAEALAEHVLEGSLSLQGKKEPSPILHDGPRYDLSLINASEDLEEIIEGLDRSRRGAVCLYGPPGTGKTAFVHYFAERLGRPLMLRRASDLLGPYVGMTEMAIAGMFREATEEGAVLLLDEADGMLRDRSGARQRWELTQTNEMLTQMESFDGIFFCSTNLVEELDRASLRRFALKVRMDPPGEEARWRLFLNTLSSLGGRAPEGDDEKRARLRVNGLDGITPGDAAAVIRRLRIVGVTPRPERLVEALAEERDARRETRGRPVGFGT